MHCAPPPPPHKTQHDANVHPPYTHTHTHTHTHTSKHPKTAGGGFGKGGGGKKVDLTSSGMAIRVDKKKDKDAKPSPADAAAAAAAGAAPSISGSGWANVGKVDDLFTVEKPSRPIVLAGGVKLCVYKLGGRVYASDLESTAYKFPLFDGRLSLDAKGRPVVEVPLDGTKYDLSSGQVLEWCPTEGQGPVRAVLGALKSKQPPINLKVYPTRIEADGSLLVKLI